MERLWVFLWDPAVQLCIQLGIPPDAISVTGVVLTAVAALLIGIGDFSFGGWLYLVGASLDLVGGSLALLAVLALATAVSRSLSIYRFLRGQDSVARSIDRTGT